MLTDSKSIALFWMILSIASTTGITRFRLVALGKESFLRFITLQLTRNRTGAFDWTTNDATNSYISNKQLHIVPTLTTETTNITGDQILNGYQVNLTRDGTCTSSVSTDCAIFSNSSSGAIIPPVRSARLTTKGKFSITYGRVEVVAKLPQGDWLWPAIWYVLQPICSGPIQS